MVDVRREFVIKEVSLLKDPADRATRIILWQSQESDPDDLNRINDARASALRGHLEHLARGYSALANFLMDEGDAYQLPVERVVTDEEPQPRRRRGRPRNYDWDEFGREVIRIANLHGLPANQAKLVRIMAEWCLDTWGVEPADSMIRERISRVYQHIKDAENS